MEHLNYATIEELRAVVAAKFPGSRYLKYITDFIRDPTLPSYLIDANDPELNVQPPCLAIKLGDKIKFIPGDELTRFTAGKTSFKFLLPPSIFVDVWKEGVEDAEIHFELHIPNPEYKQSYVLTQVKTGPLHEVLMADGRLNIPYTSTSAILMDTETYSHYLNS